uniref:Uncharacterized protein n=1 Tax=Anguilla anguilla TaxID=7936 RepID=A0A0E9TMP8_ANGAN
MSTEKQKTNRLALTHVFMNKQALILLLISIRGALGNLLEVFACET